MAYIRKLPSGKWNAVVRHPSGRRLTKTDPLKKVVTAWAQQTEMGFRAGAVALRRETFSQWCDRWLAARSVEDGTARKDASRLRLHIRPHWDTWPLLSIGRMDVQAWVNGLAASGLAGSSVGGIYGLMGTVMADAVREGLIAATPCYRVKLPKVTKPAPRWLTRDEYERIQLALATRVVRTHGRKMVTDPHAATWQALIGLACFSGLRPGELAGLDVSALDLDRGLVRVSQVLTRSGTLRPYPKSEKSVRSVPFPPEVGEMLWRIVADRSPTDPVFVTPEGGRIDFSGNFRARVWVPTLEAAGISPVRFYVCRHTACSWLVQAGVPDRKIMGFLGHADAHLINVYGHLAPDAHDDIRRAWGESSQHTVDPRHMGEEVVSERIRWSDAH